jgi:hypothetical protein
MRRITKGVSFELEHLMLRPEWPLGATASLIEIGPVTKADMDQDHAYVCRYPRTLLSRIVAKPRVAQFWRATGAAFIASDDFEVWRPRMTRLLILTSVLLAAYWLLWFADGIRGVRAVLSLG